MSAYAIIYYDGYCPFCHFWVRQLCRFDRRDKLRFSPLQKAPAHLLSHLSGDALTLVTPQKQIKEGVEAIFYVLKQQKGLIRFFLIFRFLPAQITNRCYAFIAKNRYKWFGKYDQCPLPEERYRHKFI